MCEEVDETVTLLTDARVLTPTGTVRGWLQVDGHRIAALGEGAPPEYDGEVRRLDGAHVVPGFVDLHLHGGGGASVTDGDPGEVRRALAFHRRHGTTRALASLVTAPLEHLLIAARGVAEAVTQEGGRLVGCHLEGPFLASAHRGVHDPSQLLAPDPRALTRLLEAAAGTVRVVTLAPEQPGGLDLVRQVVDAGAVAAVGHTAATYDEAVAAVAAGARLATHLCNGMRPLHHREPGAALALLEHAEVVCELINDGAHLHDGIVRTAFAVAGADRLALITDAIAATGLPDGDHVLGRTAITVSEGIARAADSGSLAGSTLTMSTAVRNTVLRSGLPLEAAVTAATLTPARVLGIDDRVGSVEVGKEADLVVLDDDLRVTAVMAGGRWERSGTNRVTATTRGVSDHE